MLRPKVTVVSQTGDPDRRVTVVSSEQSPRATVVSTREPWLPSSNILDASVVRSTAAAYRQHAGLAPEHGFTAGDMQRMVQEAGAAPLRFVFQRLGRRDDGTGVGTWYLYVRPLGGDVVRVYEPRSGLKDVRHGEDTYFVDVAFNDASEIGGDQGIPPQPVHVIGNAAVRVLAVHNNGGLPDSAYELPEATLAQLGSVQDNPFDCGPLSVAAGILARNTSNQPGS